MTLLQRTVLMVSLLLAATVAVTALALAHSTRQALLDQTEDQGVQLTRLLARGARFAQEVPAEVEEAIGEQMLVEASLAAHLVATAERAGLPPEDIQAMLQDITARTALDEVWVTDERGHAYLRNRTDIDFTFHPDPAVQPQASAFWPLLSGAKSSVVQEARVREVDDQVFKYAAVGGVDKARIVQVGYNAVLLERLRRDVGLTRLVEGLVGGAPAAGAESPPPGSDVAAIHIVDKDLATLAYGAVPGLPASAQLRPADEARVRRVVAEGEPISVPGAGLHQIVAPITNPAGEVAGVALVSLSTDHVDAAIRRELWWAAALVIGVLLAGVLASVLMARRVTGPVEAIAAAARAVEAGTFQSTSLSGPAARADELGQLARVFCRMAEEVQAREARLQRQIEALKIEIDEHKRVKQVAEITGSDYFRELRRRGQELRGSGPDAPATGSAGG